MKDVKLDKQQRSALRCYEDTLSRVTFQCRGNLYVDRGTKKRLAEIYEDITGNGAGCTGCSSDWIKRLSYWYFEGYPQPGDTGKDGHAGHSRKAGENRHKLKK